jgi:hypothetical protein
MTRPIVAVEPANITRLGPVSVRTDRARVDEVRSASGGEIAPDRVPLIFPICWLALPEIREQLFDSTGANDVVPIHESQSFATLRSLELDHDYRLVVSVTSTSQPQRTILRGTVSTPAGDLCVEFETVLRLIGLDGYGHSGRSA